jgi:hypothetical protein
VTPDGVHSPEWASLANLEGPLTVVLAMLFFGEQSQLSSAVAAPRMMRNVTPRGAANNQ